MIVARPSPAEPAASKNLLNRRNVLLSAGAALTFARPAFAVLQASIRDQIKFRVVRNGDVIGLHQLDLTRDNESLTVRITVDIEVKLGPIAVFRYTLRGIEQWAGGQVSHIDAKTNDDGRDDYMTADRGPEGLWVKGSKAPRYLAPADALPATHWNLAETAVPWINPEDGRLFHPTVNVNHGEHVALTNGNAMLTNHYVMSGDVSLELWYDSNGNWTALRFKAHDGSIVRYELMS